MFNNWIEEPVACKPYPNCGIVQHQLKLAPKYSASSMTRGVRFSEECQVHECMELDCEEQAAVYYSAQEIREIRRRIQIAILLKDREVKMMGMSTRGLERVSESPTEVERKKAFAKDFLALQRDLRLREVDAQEREDSLRRFVEGKSKSYQKGAARLAKKDEAAARRVYRADKIRWTPAASSKNNQTSFQRKFALGGLVRGFQLTRESRHTRGGTLPFFAY